MAGDQNKPGAPGTPGEDLANKNPGGGNPPPPPPPGPDAPGANIPPVKDEGKETAQQRIERLANSIESGNTSPAVVAELREIAKDVK